MAKHRIGIYEIVNTINGKRYIGSTVSFTDRFYTHRRALIAGTHHSSHLQRAWKKYGADAFVFRPMLVCSRATLLDYEQRCLDGLRPEYNECPTAGSRLGKRNTPEQNAKISAAHKGKKRGPLSEATRQKLREIGLASSHRPTMTTEQRERVNADKRGRKQRPETIAKRAIKLRVVMACPQKRAFHAAILRSHNELRAKNAAEAVRRPEYRAKRSAISKQKWADPSFRERAISGMHEAQGADWKARQQEGVARIQSDPTFHARRNAGLAAVREQVNAANRTPEARAKKRANAKSQRSAQEAVRRRAIELAASLGYSEELPNHRSGVSTWTSLIERLNDTYDIKKVL